MRWIRNRRKAFENWLGPFLSGLIEGLGLATAGAAAFPGGNLKVHLNWLGATCGLGVAGFLAICASVALAAYRDADHAGWLDVLGICWVSSGLGLLGFSVALLPYGAFRWTKNG